MYLHNTLYYLYKKEKRKPLFSASKQLAKTTKKCRLFYICDMIWCSIRYGAQFSEYQDMNFAFRTASNRKTMLTTFYNLRLYDRINPKHLRREFHDKKKFLKNFSALIHREWIDLKEATEEEVQSFLERNRKVVLKGSGGCSGKQVEVWEVPAGMEAKSFLQKAFEQGYDMAEQCLTNHPGIAVFNPTSLNTIRIVTVQLGGKVDFLFAGLRVGAKGSLLDNISQGGAVAEIDLESGKFSSNFVSAPTEGGEPVVTEDVIGYQIPYWEEVKQTARTAAMVIPEVAYVAWDICITEKGPEIIEGNESFASRIMQFACLPTEPGLKPKLESILKNGGMK